MPEVRRLKKRGATIEVVAYGEVLFTNAGPVPGWLGRFSQRVRSFAEAEAPSNKRPRWAHYGKPLKSTMRATTRTRRGISAFHLHAAVGSTAPHAYYVDQGTGIFAGNSPYKAEILPPWERFSPSLYEASWQPPGSVRRVKPVMIKGQKGQHFFDTALKRGFQSMRMRSIQLPGEGVGAMSGVLRSEPAGLVNFLGSTPSDAGFIKSLEEWRAWRDAAWDAGFILGRDRNKTALDQINEANAKLKSSTKGRNKAKGLTKHKAPKKTHRPTQDDLAPTRGEIEAKAIAQFKKQNPSIAVIGKSPNGLVVKTKFGNQIIPWRKIYGLIGETFLY
jgi:hypothetical protein